MGDTSREPSWLVNARQYIGVHETAGPQTNPTIAKFLTEAHIVGIHDDETPWCATFVSACLEEFQIRSTRSAWARSYEKWGQRMAGPSVGAIVVFERGPSSGHVGFVAGRDNAGHLMVLGGNQGDMVKLSPFNLGRVLGYRWPDEFELPDDIGFDHLPILDSSGEAVSSNEA